MGSTIPFWSSINSVNELLMNPELCKVVNVYDHTRMRARRPGKMFYCFTFYTKA